MLMKSRLQSAFTLIEMLVVISIIAILAAFAVPALTSALTKGQMTGTMNNGRQLYLAAQQMALDGSANSDPNLAWPGDYAPLPNLSQYMTRLVDNDYLKVGDVQKLLSGPGASAAVTSDNATPPTITVAGTSALKIYPVTESDASNAIFAVSRNYVYNTGLVAANGGVPNNPFGQKGFIVQRKGGDASVLRANNAIDGGNIPQFEAQVGKKPGEAQGTASQGDPANILKQP